METTKQRVGRRVREIRKKAGYRSAEALAEALEVHPNSVYDLERGDSWISPEMLEKLSAHFKVPDAAFFGEEGEVVQVIEPSAAELAELAAKSALEQLADRLEQRLLTSTPVRMTPRALRVFKAIQKTLEANDLDSVETLEAACEGLGLFDDEGKAEQQDKKSSAG